MHIGSTHLFCMAKTKWMKVSKLFPGMEDENTRNKPHQHLSNTRYKSLRSAIWRMLPSSAMVRGGIRLLRAAGNNTCSTTHRHGKRFISTGSTCNIKGKHAMHYGKSPKHLCLHVHVHVWYKATNSGIPVTCTMQISHVPCNLFM